MFIKCLTRFSSSSSCSFPPCVSLSNWPSLTGEFNVQVEIQGNWTLQPVLFRWLGVWFHQCLWAKTQPQNLYSASARERSQDVWIFYFIYVFYFVLFYFPLLILATMVQDCQQTAKNCGSYSPCTPSCSNTFGVYRCRGNSAEYSGTRLSLFCIVKF